MSLRVSVPRIGVTRSSSQCHSLPWAGLTTLLTRDGVLTTRTVGRFCEDDDLTGLVNAIKLRPLPRRPSTRQVESPTLQFDEAASRAGLVEFHIDPAHQ